MGVALGTLLFTVGWNDNEGCCDGTMEGMLDIVGLDDGDSDGAMV